MSQIGTLQILWRRHVHPIHAPGAQVFAGIAGHAQKGVVGVHHLLPFDDIDPKHAGVHQNIRPLLALTQVFLRSFQLLNIGAGAHVSQDRALSIFEWRGFGQEPAIGSCCAIAQPLFCFI